MLKAEMLDDALAGRQVVKRNQKTKVFLKNLAERIGNKDTKGMQKSVVEYYERPKKHTSLTPWQEVARGMSANFPESTRRVFTQHVGDQPTLDETADWVWLIERNHQDRTDRWEAKYGTLGDYQDSLDTQIVEASKKRKASAIEKDLVN